MRNHSAQFPAGFATGAARGAGTAWLAASPHREPRRAVARTRHSLRRAAHPAAQAYEGGATATAELVDTLRAQAVKPLRRAGGETVHTMVEKLQGIGAEEAGTATRGSGKK